MSSSGLDSSQVVSTGHGNIHLTAVPPGTRRWGATESDSNLRQEHLMARWKGNAVTFQTVPCMSASSDSLENGGGVLLSVDVTDYHPLSSHTPLSGAAP